MLEPPPFLGSTVGRGAAFPLALNEEKTFFLLPRRDLSFPLFSSVPGPPWEGILWIELGARDNFPSFSPPAKTFLQRSFLTFFSIFSLAKIIYLSFPNCTFLSP